MHEMNIHQFAMLLLIYVHNYILIISDTESFNINECITTELLQQIAVVSRSILRPGTSIVLVGQPGCRRTESLYLTAQLLACKIVLPQGIKNYSLADFYNDLKLVKF